MSRTVRKIKKKLAESKTKNETPAMPIGNIGQALNNFLNAATKRAQIMKDLDLEVLETVKGLIESTNQAQEKQKFLEQTLQETRRKYQMALDDLSSVNEELRELQAANTKLKQDKLKAEQKLQWTKVELQMAKDELKRVEEKVALEAEVEHLEDEISHCERKLAKRPQSRERYESRIKAAQEEKARCLERLNQLQELRASGNFNQDSSFRFLSEESNAALWEYINGRDSTDEVIFRTEEDEMRLLEAWGADDGGASFIKAGTVPLTDFIITFVAANSSARVIFDSDDSAGILIVDNESAGLTKRIKLAFFIRPMNETLTLSVNLGYENLLPDEKIFMENRLNTDLGKNFFVLGYKVLSLWCAIERALLNPSVVEYIAGRGLEKNDGQGDGRAVNIVAYVKRIPITVDDLLIDRESKNFERHADKWGVIGHWRECSTGKKVWVRPHEKGRKRGQKLNNQEVRERFVAIPDTGHVSAK